MAHRRRTITISGSFAARRFLPDWWMLLILGLLEVPLGVLALANPGATLAAIITVAGIWAVAVGVMRVVMSFEVKNLPKTVDRCGQDRWRRYVYDDLSVRILDAAQRSDAELRGMALQTIAWDADAPAELIDVKVEDGWVTLRGTVSWQFESDAAYEDVANLFSVIGITNDIRVLNP